MSPTNLSRRALILLLMLCAAIILMLSVEILFLVKDTDHFEEFQERIPQATFHDYLLARLFHYILYVVPVLALALYTFFVVSRTGVTSLYRLIWSLLIFHSALQRVVQTTFFNPLSMILIALYVVCILVIINIHRISEGR